MYDIIIIGGGPGGYKTAELSAKRRMAVLLIEENEIGGTCLNQGCIPFKTYLHIAGCAEKIRQLQKRGLVNGNTCSIDQSALVQNKETTVLTLRKSVENLLRRLGVITVQGRASSIRSQNDTIIVSCGESSYVGRKLVIATGSKETPFPLIAPNECEYPVIHSRQMLEMNDIPKRISIVGGGAIGLEAACFFSEMGAEVSVWEAKNTIGGELDTELAETLQKCLSKKFAIHTNTAITEFRKTGIVIKKESSEMLVETDCALLATGRIPNIDAELLQGAGIDYNKNGITISEDCRTSHPAIYACGDVTGKAMLAHTAYRQAQLIVDAIAGDEQEPIHYHLIPKIIYTHPAVFQIGWTEKECAEKGTAYRVKSLPLTYSGKYFAENGKDGAIAKMIIHAQSEEILGFGMIGNSVEEISLALELVMVNKMNIRQVRHLVFAHPTIGEIIGELAGMF